MRPRSFRSSTILRRRSRASAFVAHNLSPAPAAQIPPRVAVLKPLRGRSNSLAENLTSYLESAYPRTEFYFAVADYEDPATEVPVALRQRYQFAPYAAGRRRTRLHESQSRQAYPDGRARRASRDFVLSDADISVKRDHLRRVVGELVADEKVGIVTCLYRARPAGPLASRLEALFVNTDFCRR